jgi:hypothetical protein
MSEQSVPGFHSMCDADFEVVCERSSRRTRRVAICGCTLVMDEEDIA